MITSEDIFGCHHWGQEYEMALNILVCTETPPPTEKYQAPNLHTAETKVSFSSVVSPQRREACKSNEISSPSLLFFKSDMSLFFTVSRERGLNWSKSIN